MKQFDRTLYSSRADAGETLAEYLAAGVLTDADKPRLELVGNRWAIQTLLR